MQSVHDQLADAYRALYPVSADEKEFNRIASAARGTVRFERGEDYVIIAQCVTSEEISTYGKVRHTSWYVSLNYRGEFVTRREFGGMVEYDAVNSWIVASIVTDSKKRSN